MKTQPWMITCATALLALTCSAAVAQNRYDQNRDDQGLNHGQSKKEYRRFDDRQRQSAQAYYNQHQREAAFRHDNRWNNDYEGRIRPGYVFDSDMRRMSHPAPYEMTRGFGPAPRGYRYVIIGGHVVLVDSGYRVHDSIQFELNFGH